MENDYDERCNATLAMRLVRALYAAGVISEYQLNDILYPSIEELEKAEEQMQ